MSGGSWYSAEENWKLSDTEILKAIACAHPKFYIGCRAGKTSRYAVLDIDTNSKYHCKQQLDKLLKLLSDAGLARSSLYRSTYSGGWHLYLFFDEPISSSELRRQLVKLLALSGFEISKGTLEVFPNRSDSSQGMGLRLPLQPGFAWLNKQDLEVDHERFEFSATKALEFFVDCLESDANSYADFRKLKAYVQELETRKAKAIAHADPTYSNIVPLRRTADNMQPSEFAAFLSTVFGQMPPGIIADNWYKGRLFFHHGLAGPSQRAESIICVGHYLFYGDPSLGLPALGYGYEDEREWALQTFLTSRHNGQSKDINDGRADAIAQVERAANWTPPHRKGIEASKYTPVQPISWIRENQNRKKDARTRIQDALDVLKKQQRVFTTVELQELAACSRETLYKHKDIWRAVYEDRKNYRDISAGVFAICTDEYNDVLGADSSKIKPPDTNSSKITPPGLLAARQIAQEISMRTRRDIQRKEKEKQVSDTAASTDWSDKVQSLTAEPPAVLTIERIKFLLVVLIHYLSLAPNEEEQVTLQSYIKQLRVELDARHQPPQLLPDYG